MIHTTFIEVDLGAIEDNVRAVKAFVGQGVSVMAVVKANAYGHGLVPVARAALAGGAEWLGVARIGEGIALREAGISTPILVLSYAIPGEMKLAIRYDLVPAVANSATVSALSSAAIADGRAVRLHIKVDTGMGRYGLLPVDVVPFADWASAQPGITVEGIFTHFAVAETEDRTFTAFQAGIFMGVLEDLQAAGFTELICHAANSAGLMYHVDTHLNMVRAGICIYGLRVSDEIPPPIALKPALSLKSHLARVERLEAGSSVGYGRTFIADQSLLVGLVPVGYGDGYRRLLSGRAEVLVHKTRVPVIGRVSMDQISIDLAAVPEAAVGDEVVLIGQQGGAQISAEEVAAWAETNNYEVVTSLASRVPREYLTRKP